MGQDLSMLSSTLEDTEDTESNEFEALLEMMPRLNIKYILDKMQDEEFATENFGEDKDYVKSALSEKYKTKKGRSDGLNDSRYRQKTSEEISQQNAEVLEKHSGSSADDSFINPSEPDVFKDHDGTKKVQKMAYDATSSMSTLFNLTQKYPDNKKIQEMYRKSSGDLNPKAAALNAVQMENDKIKSDEKSAITIVNKDSNNTNIKGSEASSPLPRLSGILPMSETTVDAT